MAEPTDLDIAVMNAMLPLVGPAVGFVELQALACEVVEIVRARAES